MTMKGSLQGDFSRFFFDPRKHYSSLLMQQGRVQLDADWNAQAQLLAHRLRVETRDVIGGSGAPAGDAGFEILPYYGLLFDGESSFATLGGPGVPLFSPAGGLTLEVWVLAKAEGTLVSRASRGEGEAGFSEDFSLEILADGRLRFHRAGVAAPDLESEAAIPFGQPCQIAVAATGSESRLYVNGRSVAQDHHGCPVRGGEETTLILGASLVQGELTHLFQGFFYELRIWGAARGEDEIAATLRRNPQRADPALLGWWRFDQGRGGVVADRSLNGNPCLLGGGYPENRPRWTLRALLVGAGRYYVDGFLCSNEAKVSFTQQEDLPGATLPPLDDGEGFYLLYLDVWEGAVTASADPSLGEVALGGADTVLATRVLAQVKWMPVAGGSGGSSPGTLPEWRDLLERERDRGRLRARRDRQSVATLGNLLYRVEIHDGGSSYGWPRAAAARTAAVPVSWVSAKDRRVVVDDLQPWSVGEWVELFGDTTDAREKPGVLARIEALDPDARALTLGADLSPLAGDARPLLRRVATFKWSSRNAAQSWPVERLQEGSSVVALADSGRNDLELAAGDWVEIVDDALAFQGRAERLYQVASVDPRGRQVKLTAAVEGTTGQNPKLHPILRRWEGAAGLSPVRQDWTPLEAGLEVAFDPEGACRTGDYWWLPVRAATQGLSLPDSSDKPRPPDGVEHRHAPLALLSRDAEGLECVDCRTTFQPLTTGAVSKAGDTMDGSLEVRGDLTVQREIRAGSLHGTVATPGAVGSEALADGAVLPSKLAPGIGTVPLGGAIFTDSPEALPGFTSTGFALTLFQPEPRWDRRREIPRANDGPFASAVLQERVYTLLESGELWEYDPASNVWRQRRPLPTTRQGFALAAAGGRLFALGGLDAQGHRDGATLEYDPAADSWRERRPMPTPRSELAAATLGGTLYTLGGRSGRGGGKVSDCNEAYDPDSDVWSARRPLPAARYGVGAAVLSERLHVLGGEEKKAFGRSMTAAHDRYNPSMDRWETGLAPLPSPRSGAGTLAAAGRIYVLGGRSSFGETSEVDEYDPAVNGWQPRPPLPAPVAGPGAAAVGGTLYVIGGSRTDAPSVPLVACAMAAVFWVQRKVE
jgi:N-acetylneuraminic acid mutarotase